MALGETEVERIRTLMDRVTDPGLVFQCLKQLLPGVSISRCDAGDVDNDEPFIETDTVALYFLDTSAHCIRITESPELATGVVVAAKGSEFI